MVGVIEKVSELTATVFLPKEMVQADGGGGWGEGAGKGSAGPRGGEQLCPVAPHPSLTPAHISQLLERKRGTEEANSPFSTARSSGRQPLPPRFKTEAGEAVPRAPGQHTALLSPPSASHRPQSTLPLRPRAAARVSPPSIAEESLWWKCALLSRSLSCRGSQPPEGALAS